MKILSGSLYNTISIFCASIMMQLSCAHASESAGTESENVSRFSAMQLVLLIGAFLILMVIIYCIIMLVRAKNRLDDPTGQNNEVGSVHVTHEDEIEILGVIRKDTNVIVVNDDTTLLDGPSLLLAGHLNTGEAINARIGYAELYNSANHSVYIGRDPSMWLCLRDSSVSRKHAKLRAYDGKIWVADNYSANGTQLSGSYLSKKEFNLLTNGQTVRFGNIEMKVSLR